MFFVVNWWSFSLQIFHFFYFDYVQCSYWTTCLIWYPISRLLTWKLFSMSWSWTVWILPGECDAVQTWTTSCLENGYNLGWTRWPLAIGYAVGRQDTRENSDAEFYIRLDAGYPTKYTSRYRIFSKISGSELIQIDSHPIFLLN